MKTNPFYTLSVSAMLLGCWLLSQALHLQAGQLRSLLVLMAVLQLYESLLVGLGTFLARTGRAPRDGVTVLLLESLFLMDAPLLATECVTADARVGTAVALATLTLAVAKLAWVRRTAPGLLSTGAAVILAAQSAFVLTVPVAAAHLAEARLFTARALWLLWWATLALPFAERRLREETHRDDDGSGSGARLWTWTPLALAVLHLWAIGYVHAIPFRPAYVAPLLLGLAATAEPDRRARKVALPALAVVLSLGQRVALGFALPGPDGPFVSPLGLALIGVVVTWTYLAWRDREGWLAVLTASLGVAGLLGSLPSSAWRAVGRLLRSAEGHLPRDAFGWGVLAVVAAFVLLAAGARRSLAEPPEARRR